MNTFLTIVSFATTLLFFVNQLLFLVNQLMSYRILIEKGKKNNEEDKD